VYKACGHSDSHTQSAKRKQTLPLSHTHSPFCLHLLSFLLARSLYLLFLSRLLSLSPSPALTRSLARLIALTNRYEAPAPVGDTPAPDNPTLFPHIFGPIQKSSVFFYVALPVMLLFLLFVSSCVSLVVCLLMSLDVSDVFEDRLPPSHAPTHTCSPTCTHPHTHTLFSHTHAHTYKHAYTHKHTYAHTHTHTHEHTRTHTHTHKHMHTHTHIHTQTHTHTHTHANVCVPEKQRARARDRLLQHTQRECCSTDREGVACARTLQEALWGTLAFDATRGTLGFACEKAVVTAHDAFLCVLPHALCVCYHRLFVCWMRERAYCTSHTKA